MRRSLAPRNAAVPAAVEGKSIAPASEGQDALGTAGMPALLGLVLRCIP